MDALTTRLKKNPPLATISRCDGRRKLREGILQNYIAKGKEALCSIKSFSQNRQLIRSALGFILILLLILLPPPVRGQDSPITASVNLTELSTDELVVLTVTVVDDSPQQPRPILPRLDGLAVIDLDISTEVSLVNGQIQTEVTYTYLLQPRRTGLLTIPPVSVKIDDQIFKTAPISVRVGQGAPPAPSPGNAVNPDNISPPANLEGQDFFVEAQVSLAKPYVGQQFIYTFRFYQALQVYREPQYEGPLFSGFDTIGLPVREFNLDVADRTYLITEIRTGLFAKRPGNMTIGPARLMLPGNIYEEPIDLYTEQVEVDVKPVPDDAPPNFSGAVGQYEIKAWFSPQVAVVNQPSIFSVAVSGIGNIQEIPEPIWPELNWRSYNSLTSLTTEMQGDLMTGTRVYEKVVIPDQVGEFTILEATFVYFDPVAAEYRTMTTEPFSVKIIPAPTPEPTVIAVAPTATPVNVVALNTPAAVVGEPFDSTASESRDTTWRFMPVAVILFLGICVAIPVAAILGAGGVWLWQRQQPREVAPLARIAKKEEKLQQPAQQIHPALVVAMKTTNNNYKAVSQALNTYLSQVLKTSVNGLTRTELAERLREHGLAETLIERIADCLAQSEIGRYGPITDDAGWSLMTTADELLFELDQAFGPVEGDSDAA